VIFTSLVYVRSSSQVRISFDLPLTYLSCFTHQIWYRRRIRYMARRGAHSQWVYCPRLFTSSGWRVEINLAADSGSIYDPHPTLTYSWNPDPSAAQESTSVDLLLASRMHRRTESNAIKPHAQEPSAQSLELGPHPADPHSTILPAIPTVSNFHGPSFTFSPADVTKTHTRGTSENIYATRSCSEKALGQELWVYCGTAGWVRDVYLCTFDRRLV